MVNKTKGKKEMSKKRVVTKSNPEKGCSVCGWFCWFINKITKCLGFKCEKKDEVVAKVDTIIVKKKVVLKKKKIATKPKKKVLRSKKSTSR